MIRWTLEKAIPKFSGNVPSILVISDDAFVNLIEWRGAAESALTVNTPFGWGPGYFHRSEYAALGAVCLFRGVEYLGDDTVQYERMWFPNPNALPTAQIPPEIQPQLFRTHYRTVYK
jgi:hypothetical protein